MTFTKPKKQPRIPKPKDPKKSELFKIKQDFVNRNYEAPINWPVAIKVLGELFEVVNDLKFWANYKLIKPFPLLWLKTEKGKAFLLKEYDRYSNNQREIPLEPAPKRFTIEEKIGEDIQINPKAKTLKDFLK